MWFCRNQAEKTDSHLAAVKTAEKLLKVIKWLFIHLAGNIAFKFHLTCTCGITFISALTGVKAERKWIETSHLGELCIDGK